MASIAPQILVDLIHGAIGDNSRNIIFVAELSQSRNNVHWCVTHDDGSLAVFLSGKKYDYGKRSFEIGPRKIHLKILSHDDDDIVKLRDAYYTESARTLGTYVEAIDTLQKTNLGSEHLLAAQRLLKKVVKDGNDRNDRLGASTLLQYERTDNYGYITWHLSDLLNHCRTKVTEPRTDEIRQALLHLSNFFEFFHELRHFRDSEAHFFRWRLSDGARVQKSLRIYSLFPFSRHV
ncbi:hypothetical protein BKA69DRAFT_465617 [Paraphysoderma sedebokerense]|nr:hypothetical protein BKA69DRAFT_465617 [Paraphysoderma sedebokerense]